MSPLTLTKRRFALLVIGSIIGLSALGDRPRGAVSGDASAIWRKSLLQDSEMPMRAEMTMMQRHHGAMFTTKAHVVKGSHGRYRMEYVLPAEARGRIVFSDGQTNWQYEPAQNLMARTELPLLADADRAAEALIESNYHITLVSDRATASGRAAYLLHLIPRHAGKSKQHRWIDRQTYKTLRVETYYADGILARVLMYDQVALPAIVADADFEPMQAKSIRTIRTPGSAPDRRRQDFARTAATFALKPEMALGFKLIEISASTVNSAPITQLLYSDGIETVSIFVQKGRTESLAASPSWRRLNIEGTPVFQIIDGHLNTLVWIRNGRRYTAVSHLGSASLQAVIASQLP